MDPLDRLLRWVRDNQNIILILLLGLVLRIILSSFGTLQLDFNTFRAWGNILVQNGFTSFYSGWSDYLPGYLYVLWLLTKIQDLSSIIPVNLLFKLPAMLSDIAIGYLIYAIVKKEKSATWAIIFAASFVFNPGIIANSTLWGQVDSLTTLFSLLAIFTIDSNPHISAASLATGTLIKPQAAIAALVILVKMINEKWRVDKMLLYIMLAGAIFVLGFLPFVGGRNIISFIYERISTTLNQYPYTSVNAFNFWGLFGFWIKDGADLISTKTLGYVLFLAAFVTACFKLVKDKNIGYYHLLAIGFLANFFFFTRMHERHLLPSLAPLTIMAAFEPILLIPLALLSLGYTANLYYSFVWITQNFKNVFSPEQISLFIILNLVSFSFVFLSIIKPELLKSISTKISKIKNFNLAKEEKEEAVIDVSQKTAKIVISIIIAFSLITRVAWLAKPTSEYFDEVYHAFTARQMMHGNPMAWEWWNTPPQGFAYEWTHPPLAKEGMWLGMLVFGENAFGWRIVQALLGTGVVYLIYLLSREIFRKESIALLAAAVFSLDGLALVMSRIGMNDTYMLFFGLLAVLFFVKDRYFLSSVAYGLSLSSKWSALWIIPILGVVFLLLKKKLSISLAWFFVIPIAIYIASYTPMFLGSHKYESGNNFDIFVGVQKQMWWYHTRLKATHPYTSMWWSWPLDLRPVYLYTSDEVNSLVSRIYAFGNPFILWSGLIAVIFASIEAIVERKRKLAIIVFSYFMFFVPWALSPRIMFFYHYLPSIPFLAVALGWFLAHQNKKFITGFLLVGVISFVYFYPHWAGLQVPLWLDRSYYWLGSWR